MYTFSPAITQLLGCSTKRLCWAYRLARADGVVLRWTTHDREIEVNVGTDYEPVLEDFVPGVANGQAHRKQSGVKPESSALDGPISSDITVEDCRIGLFRNAELHAYVVDWRYPWLGRFQFFRYFVADVRFSGVRFEFDVKGLMDLVDVNVGNVAHRHCRRRLGDDGCKVDLTLKASGTKTVATPGISGFADAHPRRRFRSNLTAQPDGYWQAGDLYWLTGNNAINGANQYQVRRSIQSNGEIELLTATRYDIAPGDTFKVDVGCGKELIEFCKNKFADATDDHTTADFGGFPTMKGNDAGLKTPKPKK